jgi:hypothetical protein
MEKDEKPTVRVFLSAQIRRKEFGSWPWNLFDLIGGGWARN